MNPKNEGKLPGRVHGLPYRQALAQVRAARADRMSLLPFAERLLIEAVEGCEIRHCPRADEWDGVGRAVIADLRGVIYRLELHRGRGLVA